MGIENRRDLSEFLENRMTRSYEQLLEEGKYEYEQALLKTYVIESNLNSVHELPQLESYNIIINQTEDNYLFNLSANSVEKDEDRAEFYVDTMRQRFWLFHSVGRSDFTDRFIRKVTSTVFNGLDNPWFPTQFMEEIAQKTLFRGFTLRYKDEFAKEEEDKEIPISRLSMRLWGYGAPKVLRILRKDEDLRSSIALSGVSIKHFVDDIDFVIEDINYTSKFTAKGTSIEGHFYLVNDVLDNYQKILNEIEAKRISYSQNEYGYKFKGAPITVVFRRPIDSLNDFFR